MSVGTGSVQTGGRDAPLLPVDLTVLLVNDLLWRSSVDEHAGMHRQQCQRQTSAPRETAGVFCREPVRDGASWIERDLQPNVLAFEAYSLQVVVRHFIRNLS